MEVGPLKEHVCKVPRYEVRYHEEHHVISGAGRFFAQVVSSSANLRGLTQHTTAG